jgi:hypothetical protein
MLDYIRYLLDPCELSFCQARQDPTMFAMLSVEAMFQEKAFFGGIAAFTRQRTTRGLPAKRKRMIDGSAKSSAQLHVNTINLVEMSYKCVDGEAPAAAVKLHSGTAF